jgi:hypothetical protein
LWASRRDYYRASGQLRVELPTGAERMRNLLMYGEDNYYKVPPRGEQDNNNSGRRQKNTRYDIWPRGICIVFATESEKESITKRNGIAGELNGLKERLTIVIQHSLSLFHGHGPELLLVPSLDLWTLLRILSIVCPVSK